MSHSFSQLKKKKRERKKKNLPVIIARKLQPRTWIYIFSLCLDLSCWSSERQLSSKWWLHSTGAASSWEEIPHVQGKRNPSKTVGAERGHQRAERLKPQLQKTSQTDHMDHSLVELNKTKPCPVGPPKMGGSWWRGLTKCGPLEKGMANHFSIPALRTPWEVWKGKKIGPWKMNSPGQ